MVTSGINEIGPQVSAQIGLSPSRFMYTPEVLVNLVHVRMLGRNIKSIKETTDLQCIIFIDTEIPGERLLLEFAAFPGLTGHYQALP